MTDMLENAQKCHSDSEPKHTVDVPKDKVWKRLHSTQDGSGTSLVPHSLLPHPYPHFCDVYIHELIKMGLASYPHKYKNLFSYAQSSTGITLHPRHRLSIHNLSSPIPRCPAKLFNFPTLCQQQGLRLSALNATI